MVRFTRQNISDVLADFVDMYSATSDPDLYVFGSEICRFDLRYCAVDDNSAATSEGSYALDLWISGRGMRKCLVCAFSGISTLSNPSKFSGIGDLKSLWIESAGDGESVLFTFKFAPWPGALKIAAKSVQCTVIDGSSASQILGSSRFGAPAVCEALATSQLNL